MNIEPCVRLGIRISPKISENPAESRNNRPPNVTLLTVSSSQNVISAALTLPGCLDLVARMERSAIRGYLEGRSRISLRFLRATGVLALRQWRIIARIDRVREV